METKRKDCLSINKQLEINPSDLLLKESLAELKTRMKRMQGYSERAMAYVQKN